MKRAVSLLLCVILAFGAVVTVSAEGTTTEAEAYVLYCPDNGEILASENENERMKPASTTKLMTTLITLEHAAKGNEIITFTDEMTAEDVVFSLKRATSPQSVFASSKGRYIDPDGFVIEDKYTVIVKTRAPFGGFLESMKHPYASILCKRAVEEAGNTYSMNPVGTGAFKLIKWTKGEKLELEAFADYHSEKPAFTSENRLMTPSLLTLCFKSSLMRLFISGREIFSPSP